MKLIKQIVIVVIITLSMLTGLMAQTNEMTTDFKIGVSNKGYDLIQPGCANGRAWRTLNSKDRLYFIGGIQEGLILARREGLGAERIRMPQGFTISDFIEQIDKFYSDSANLRIPIIEVYVYAIKKLKGESSKDLSNLETSLRKTYKK
jgi:hypothetical protein